MKLKDNFLNKESSHYSVGLNTFSLWSTVMLWAHFAGHLTWWAFPLTLVAALIGYGTEIVERKKSSSLGL
jgi:hypothetical protein